MRGRRRIPAKLFLRRTKAHARRILVNNKAGDALGLFFAGPDHNNIDVIITRAGDKLLRAVYDIMLAIAPRACLQRCCVRTAAGFRQAVAGDFLHRHKVRQITRLKLRAAKAIDHPRSHIMDRNEGACGGAAISHRFHDQRCFQPSKASAARFFGHVNGAKAKFARRFPDIDRIMRLFVPFGSIRRNRIRGEFARHVLDGDLIVRQFKLVLHNLAVASRF